MQLDDIIRTNILFNSINKIDIYNIINTGNIIIDTIIIIIFLQLIIYMFQGNINNVILHKLNIIFKYFNNTNKLIFYTTDHVNEKESSKRFRAIMFFISKNNDDSVKSLIELTNYKYERRDDCYRETNKTHYRVDQNMKFNIDANIQGAVYYQEKKQNQIQGHVNFCDYCYLEISSNKLTLNQLQEWVNNKLNEYDDYLKFKLCDKQLLVDISWDPIKKDTDIYYGNWDSNVTFENRFFTNKEDIISKINFFLNNPDWYKKRGIPYTMGFLLWGEPGCGKTGFIKAIMNLTKRHGVSFKLNNKFDMNKLKDIIFNDEIDSDVIIPLKNRILIFEDIDCMGDIVNERDNKIPAPDNKITDAIESDSENDSDTIIKSSIELLNGIISTKLNKENKETKENNYNNNLSFFLNILDGLQECNGRIIIMTTNKPNTLDKALIRPGRIDYNIHFTKATCLDIKNMIQFYWDTKINININEINNYKYTHAEITNLCRLSNSLEETLITLS